MRFLTPRQYRYAIGQSLFAALCLGVSLFAGQSSAVGGDNKQDAKQKDEIHLFQGNWTLTRVFKDGMDIPEEFLKEIKINFSGNTLNIAIMDMQMKATIKIDSTKKPKEIDLKFETDDHGDGFGIYEFKGDEVKIYAAESKDRRPKDFKTDPAIVIVLQRMAAEKDAKGLKKGGGERLRLTQAKDAKHQLQGSWTITSGSAGGQALPPELVGKIKAAFVGDKATLDSGSGPSKSGTFKVDDKTTPRQLDMTVDGKTGLAIYEVNGDILKLCLAPPGSPTRPNGFDSPAGSNNMNMVFKRDKTETKKSALLASVTTALLDEQDKKAGKSDIDLIQGDWIVESILDDGMPLPDEIREMVKFAVKGDKIEIKLGDLAMKGTYTVDETKKPKTVDIPMDGGSGFIGIYEMAPDKVTMCLAAKEKDARRPTEFKSPEGSGFKLVVLKRAPKTAIPRRAASVSDRRNWPSASVPGSARTEALYFFTSFSFNPPCLARNSKIA